MDGWVCGVEQMGYARRGHRSRRSQRRGQSNPCLVSKDAVDKKWGGGGGGCGDDDDGGDGGGGVAGNRRWLCSGGDEVSRVSAPRETEECDMQKHVLYRAL